MCPRSLKGRLTGSGRDIGARGQNLVDDAVLDRLFGRQEVIPLGVFRDRVDRPAGVFRHDLVQSRAQVQDLFRVDLDIGRLPREATTRLMDHHARIGLKPLRPIQVRG